MTPERWAQIEALFHRAADCDPERRVALLDDSCSDDPELRREVEALLSRDWSARGHVGAAVYSEFKEIGYPLAGTVVSHYRILEGLGGGGMGLVYRAEDIRLGRLVALKFLPEESANNPVALARFEREARAVSAVEHPNICPIYEFGEHEGRPFLVIQLLEGETLRELLESRRSEGSKPGVGAAGQRNMMLPVDQVLDLALQIADGLHAAHQKGIIHRDIKPANIFVTKDGHAKLLDFGLAKLAEDVAISDDDVAANTEEAGERARNLDPVLSRTGQAMGTAAYMSPEQVRGEKLDARTDLFSFGLVLYEMVTGQRAFVGDTRPALYGAILNQSSAPVRDLNPKLPVHLDRIINKALEKNREARYQTVAEMRTDLETVKRAIAPRTLPARRVIASAAVLVFLVAGSIFWSARRRPTSLQSLPDLKLQQLTVNSSENPVKSGAISPDGTFLAYVDGKGLHVKKVGTDEAQSVPAPEGLNNSDVAWEIIPANWFPDSKRFLVNAHPASEMDSEWSSQTTSIWMVSVLGGPLRKLRDHAIAWSVSPDGSLISFGTNTGKLGEREIWLMDSNGRQARRLYETNEDKAIGALYFFPDGQHVSYISTDSSGDTLVARDLKGGPVATLLPPSEVKKMGDAAWLPEGRIIYSDPCIESFRPDEPCNYWIMRMNTTSGKILEERRRLTNWVGFTVNGPSVTADGKQVAFLKSSRVGFVNVADIESGGKRVANTRRFTMEEAGDDTFRDWTNDSQALIVHSNRHHQDWIRKQSLNSDLQETLVSGMPGYDENAFVSPDDKWLIVQSVTDAEAPSRLERIPINGGTPELILDMLPGWSGSMCSRPPSSLCAVAEQTADHKQAVITSFDPVKGRGPELARFNLSPEYETTRMGVFWRISNDGTKLAFAPGPRGPIQIRSLMNGREQVLHVNHLPREGFVWAADGKGLVTHQGNEILYLDLKGNSKVWWKCNDECYALPSPDGRHLAIGDQRNTANIWMMENF